MKFSSFLAFVAAAILPIAPSFANVTLIDNNGWKATMGGFVEFDGIYDSSRDFTEVPGNTPIEINGSRGKENGRTQFSIRNSRIDFGVNAPEVAGWGTRAYLEFDLLGYDPNPNTSAPVNSEASFFTNPTLRVRHAYLAAEKSGWKILVGQYWTLLGWQTQYNLATVSVSPIPGVLYERTPQILVMKELQFSPTKLQLAANVARPAQRDSEIPNFEAGARLSFDRWKSAYAISNSDVSLQPLSFALTGSLREFVTADLSAIDSKNYYTAYALAADAFIPILTSSDEKEHGNSLALTGEFSYGQGYGDNFGSWTGNLAQLPTGSGAMNAIALDAGQGGYDNATKSTFKLARLRSLNAQLQYHFPLHCNSFVTAGYAQLDSSNISDRAPAAGKTIYNRSSAYFASYFHDFTSQLRVGLEYSIFTTHYADNNEPSEQRIMGAGYFRF